LCKNLKDLPEDKINSLKVRRSEVTGEIETKCFFERMDEYLEVGKRARDLIHDGINGHQVIACCL
jgi:hypothetical protein